MKYLWTLLIVVLLGGCSSVVDVKGDKLVAPTKVNLRFSLLNDDAATTRVHLDKWEPNDEIGLFMANSVDVTDMLAENYRYINRSEVESESGLFVLDDTYKPLYYPTDKRVDFLAYYPYQEVLPENKISLDLTDQSQINDFLVAHCEGNEELDRVVNLEFRHRLVLIDIVVEAGVGVDPNNVKGSNLLFKIDNVPLKGDYQLLSGEFVNDAQAFDVPLTVDGVDEGNTVKYRAYILPIYDMEATAPSLSLKLNNSGRQFTMLFKSAKTVAFDPGRRYSYRLSLNAKGISFVGSSISDRTVVDKGFIEGVHDEHPELNMEYQQIYSALFYMGMKGNLTNMKQHHVELGSYYISKYEVTAEQFLRYINGISTELLINGTDTFAIINGYLKLVKSDYMLPTGIHYNASSNVWELNSNEGVEGPMVNVTYWGASGFAEWAGGRLPTEAEWEYACRGPGDLVDTSLYYTGNDISTADANFSESGIGKPMGKRAYPPNPFGLYNMAGNVEEFCLDGYDMNYGLTPEELSSLVINPKGPKSYSHHLTKGGSFKSNKINLQSASRVETPINTCYDAVGFRIVKPL